MQNTEAQLDNWTGLLRNRWEAPERQEFVARMERKLRAKESMRRGRRRISLGGLQAKARVPAAR